MRFVVFEAVEILVSLATRLAIEWLLLFHAQSPRVWSTGLWVDNGESTVSVFV